MTEPHNRIEPPPRTGEVDLASSVNASHFIHGLYHFARLVRHRKHILFVSVLAATILAGLYYATATRYFESQASLLIMQAGGDVLSTSIGLDGSTKRVATYRELFKSGAVLEKTFDHLPAEFRVDFEGPSKEKWAAVLAANLTTQAVRDTNIINIQYRSKDPYTAKAVVAAVLTAYFEFVEETHKGNTGAVLNTLTAEKTELETKLAAKEAELLQARQNAGEGGLTDETSNPVTMRALQLNTALIEAQKTRLDCQAALATFQASLGNRETLLEHLPLIQNAIGRDVLLTAVGLDANSVKLEGQLAQNIALDRIELDTLGKFYGSAHARVVGLRDRIRVNEEYLAARKAETERRLHERISDSALGPMVLMALNQAVSQAAQREGVIRASYDEAQKAAVLLTGNTAQLDLLDHEIERLRSSHDVLLNQIANLDLRQEQGDFRATVIKEPEASLNPASPRFRNVFSVALALALLLGGATIYVLDLLDDRFRSPEEMRAQLNLPVLAVVRKLKPTAGAGVAGLQTHLAPDSPASEGFRTLRTSLAFHSSDTKRLVISSAEPGDGKTTLLANLAVSIVQAGKKTLLIDMDLRRPGLTALFALKGRPGVSDILRTTGAVADAAKKTLCATELPGLDVIPAGARRPNPSELISGQNVDELLAWADATYDQVLIDSPPVLAASDAQLLGRLVDGVMLVVDAKKNQRRAILRAMESFRSLGINVIGAIVNRVEASDGGGYGYGYGYGYEYRESSSSAKDAAPKAAGDNAAGSEERLATVSVEMPAPQDSLVVPRRVA